MSQGLRGRSVPSTPRQPTPPLKRGSPTAATPSKTFLTLSKILLTLLQKGLTSRGSSLGGWGGSVGPPARCPPLTLQPWLYSLVPLPRPCARAPPHTYLITSSAWNRSAGGMVRPSALAVLRLTTMISFVGNSTGKSPGAVPCKILCTYAAARRLHQR